MRRFSEATVREMLEAAVRCAGSQAAFADQHNISRQFLTDVLKGRRGLSGAILDALGLEKVVEFQRKD